MDGGRLNSQSNKDIALWLVITAVMIFLMIIIGGLTRLTESGLSMVDWRPVDGWLPPMNAGEWEAAFARYREFPEFKVVNHGMDLEGFKSIFWLEYIHRLLGRIVGVVFLLPLLFFIVRGRIRGHLAWGLAGLFLLGAVQGGIGWIMVLSGMVDEPRVSPYRLTLHLGFAVLIYGLVAWLAMRTINPVDGSKDVGKGLVWRAGLLTGLIDLTILSGGLVAGLDAGLIFNTFPLMDGRWIPVEYMDYHPVGRSFFEHVPTVQWDHRVLAVATVFAVFLFWNRVRRTVPRGTTRTVAHLLLIMAFVQAGLGISTLLLAVPIPLASMHQGGAVILLTLSLVVFYRLVHRLE
ncbi:MAG: COX15/CtaA family protein [Magnetococcales bacterium]|nr:COX15/CtaA family protein [Magnetococcales bacterium]